MRCRGLIVILLSVFPACGQELATRAQEFLTALIRIDSTNPPGNETPVAQYLKSVADRYGIAAQVLGGDPARLNFVARIPGSGRQRPLMLMSHSDVVPAERAQWTADPFGAEIRDGALYGRGTQDTKGLLAAELAVLVELKLRGVKLERDIILLSEADEEAGSTGIQWLIANAWPSIDADAALNEGGGVQDLRSGVRLFQVQTSEKIPTRVVLTARGTAGHASMPRPDNAVLRLARALLRLEGEQPVRLNATTERYLSELARLSDYQWLAPLAPQLQREASAAAAANQIRLRDPEMDAQLRTTVSPTMLRAGTKINVIPNSAEAQVDVRRLPNETKEEVLARLRAMVNDPAVEVTAAEGQDMPATEPSALDHPVYRAMERVFRESATRAVVVPYMLRGATDGSYLRQKGMAVYGVPVFLRENGDSRAHGNDERISLANLAAGTELLWKIVLTAGGAQ